MIKTSFLFLTTIVLCLAGKQTKSISQDHIAAVFEKHHARGAFILYNLKADIFTVYNSSRVDSAAIPASTFKIFNSLVILEEGVLKNENEPIKWDGEKRWLDQWNKDHNLKSAIKYSVVWFYQECARRVGQERMQFWIDSVGYGNRDISGGIDRFWLDGSIRISPRQQIEFLKRLYFDKLPFSKRTMAIVKKIVIRKKAENYTLHAKTGWAFSSTPQIGWYIGYLERENNVYFFAMNVDISKNEDAKKHRKITFEVLGLE